jgi:hypothetical protein
LLILGLCWMIVGATQLTQSFIDRKTEMVNVIRWTEDRLPRDARLVTFSLTHTFRHYSRLEARDLFDLQPSQLVELAAEDQPPAFLLLDVAAVDAQWRGRPPFANYQLLRDGPGLHEVGRRGHLTLFRIGGESR